MTPRDPPAADSTDTQVRILINGAKTELRRRTDDRWVEVSDRILTRALTATRRSHPVRAQARSGLVQVSEQVLVAHLRRALEGTVQGASLRRISVQIQGRDHYVGLVIVMIAQFGANLLSVADQVRDLAAATLRELLGPITPPVTVHTIWVHFGDVTSEHPAPKV